MATIKRFEDILSWQKARELNKFIGDIIDKGKFGRSYKLVDQIEGSSGSIMDKNSSQVYKFTGSQVN